MKKDLELTIEIINNPFFEDYTKIDYGKAMATPNEYYIKFSCDPNNLLNDNEDLEILKENNIDRSNNGGGFDLYHISKNIRFQTKFRQVDGTYPYSRQVHFENTRRMSNKNNNDSSNTGHVCYSSSEFDYVIITLCHIKNGIRPNYTDWSFSLVPVSDILGSNPDFCLPHIPSSILKKNFCKDIEELKDRISKL